MGVWLWADAIPLDTSRTAAANNADCFRITCPLLRPQTQTSADGGRSDPSSAATVIAKMSAHMRPQEVDRFQMANEPAVARVGWVERSETHHLLPN
jgi:hypothetical protein